MCRLFVCLLILGCLCGCDNDPTSVVSQNDTYHYFIEDLGVELVFDFDSSVGKSVSVINSNDHIIGVKIEDYPHEEVVIFEDYWIRPGDSSFSGAPYLDHNEQMWVIIMVYKSEFASYIYRAIELFGDSFVEQLEEWFGQEWLHSIYYRSVILE